MRIRLTSIEGRIRPKCSEKVVELFSSALVNCKHSSSCKVGRILGILFSLETKIYVVYLHVVVYI